MWMTALTFISCVFIVGWAIYVYGKPLWKLHNFVKSLDTASTPKELAQSYHELSKLDEDYSSTKTFTIDGQGNKTIADAEDYYNRSTIAHAIGVNLKKINSAPAQLSGLGVLGTFLGLTISVWSFNSNSSAEIMRSIQTLLGGMGTAFGTSLVGMTCALIYTHSQKSVYNRLDEALRKWCSGLDKQYHISHLELLRMESAENQRELVAHILSVQKSNEKNWKTCIEEFGGLKNSAQYVEAIVSKVENLHHATIEQSSNLGALKDTLNKMAESQQETYDALVTCDEDGNAVCPGDMLQNLYEEAEKQSQSLESFTTDLSNELNTSLGKTMDDSIIPVIRDLERAHQEFNHKLDQLSDNIQSPATDMVSAVISELESSMKQMTGEFKESISGDTILQLNKLASSLSSTTSLLNSLPQTIQMVSTGISDNFNKVKDVMDNLQATVLLQQEDMLSKSRSANNDMANDMKAKFEELTSIVAGSLIKLNQQQSDLVDNQSNSVKETMKLISESMNANVGSIEQTIDNLQAAVATQQQEMLAHSRSANEEMGNEMRARFDDLMRAVTTTLSEINHQQHNLIDTQGRSTREVEHLLTSFAESINRMKQSNVQTENMLIKVQTIGERLNESSERINNLSSLMKEASEHLMTQQKENIQQYMELQRANQETVEDISQSIRSSKEMLEEYKRQYEIIKGGLEDIFGEISKGLQDYSATLRKSTGDALSEYSNALETSTKGLQNIAEALSESAEELSDGLDKIKSRIR